MESVLVIDKEKGIIELLKRFLSREGFHVKGALNGKEAIEKMKKRPCYIVIIDTELPDMKAAELTRLLKQYNPVCNIVMITPHSSGDIIACLANGACDFFTRPFRDIDVMVKAVKGLADKIRRWNESIPFDLLK